jgi:hypothetical protein
MRAIDDEASLTLALGAIFNYVTARSITHVFHAFFVMTLVGVLLSLTDWWWILRGGDRFFPPLLGVCLVLTYMLFGMLMASRSVHGRELAVSSMECQINTQSTPDAIGLSKIVTLVRQTYVKSLRHGIYDHEECAKTISDWVRSQLCAPPPVRQEKGKSRVSDADHGPAS